MSSHNSTPKSILNAPTATVVVISDQSRPNRAARRHFRTETGKTLTIPKAYRQSPMNPPFVLPK